tara:strand:- start:336 stop:596 length:261 start_codon:yes stop_codon:yes gene_type:complete
MANICSVSPQPQQAGARQLISTNSLNDADQADTKAVIVTARWNEPLWLEINNQWANKFSTGASERKPNRIFSQLLKSTVLYGLLPI